MEGISCHMRAEKLKQEKEEIFCNTDKLMKSNTIYKKNIKDAPIVVEMKQGNTVIKIQNIRIEDAK